MEQLIWKIFATKKRANQEPEKKIILTPNIGTWCIGFVMSM
jgi:hypothetical protein